MFNIEKMQEMFSNPYGNGIKKYIFEILKENYQKHENIIEKLSENVRSAKDYQNLGNLLNEIYKIGYTKAVEQHKEILEKYGLKAKIVIPQNQNKDAH